MDSRVGTALGMALFVGGILLLASGIPLGEGSGLAHAFGEDVPGWAFAAALLGGPLAMVAGATVGMRYGHFERYHRDYDPETGRIESGHPFATLQRWVSKSDAGTSDVGTSEAGESPADHPEKFVLRVGRRHVAVGCALPTALAVGYVVLASPGLFGWGFYALIAAIAGLTSLATFLLLDRYFVHSSEVDYRRG